MIPAADLRATLEMAALSAAAAVCLACNAALPPSSCQLGQVSVYPASRLMLLPDARLQRAPDGFFLFGVDQDVLRWVHIDEQRNAGPERQAPLPANRRRGPWFAAAGRSRPADTVLIASGLANGNDLDISVVAVPADGSAAPSMPTVVATITDGAKTDSDPAVSMTTSTLGMHAGLVWTATPTSTVMAAGLAGDGRRMGDALAFDAGTPARCVGFIAGKSELSVAYLLSQSDQPVVVTKWKVVEMAEIPSSGGTRTLTVTLSEDQLSCPLALATPGGYALVWQYQGGSRLGSYTESNMLFDDHLFVSAVEFGGPALQPPIAGLGLTGGDDLAVVFARAGAGEVWRVSSAGVRQPGTLILPSQNGDLGGISSVPVGKSLVSTYADYVPTADAGAPADAGDSPASQRYLFEITCL